MLYNNRITTDIALAANHIRNGEVVSFPTETVYGLGADATNEQAIAKVFAYKGRPADHPLIVHLADISQLHIWAQEIPKCAYLLAEHFWPGPLTLILQKQPSVSKLITGGQDTIGIRIPQHPLTLNMLKLFNGGIVGPSANKFGKVSPTCAEHVAKDLNDKSVLILDGGSANVGIESTIVDLTNNTPIVRRAGSIAVNTISKVLQQPVDMFLHDNKVRTPGNAALHYAPSTPILLVAKNDLEANIYYHQKQRLQLGVLSMQPVGQDIIQINAGAEPSAYARDLYANLRALDQQNCDLILIEQPPEEIEWSAINDRLARASKNYSSLASLASK